MIDIILYIYGRMVGVGLGLGVTMLLLFCTYCMFPTWLSISGADKVM